MESVVNIAIPNIADTKLLNKIIKLSGEKLIKVLELGIIAYESMENQKQRWENSDFNKIIVENIIVKLSHFLFFSIIKNPIGTQKIKIGIKSHPKNFMKFTMITL